MPTTQVWISCSSCVNLCNTWARSNRASTLFIMRLKPKDRETKLLSVHFIVFLERATSIFNRQQKINVAINSTGKEKASLKVTYQGAHLTRLPTLTSTGAHAGSHIWLVFLASTCHNIHRKLKKRQLMRKMGQWWLLLNWLKKSS